MTDQLKQHMLDAYLNNKGSDKDPKSKARFERVAGLLDKLRTGYFPVQKNVVEEKFKGKQRLEYIKTPRLRPFEAAWRMANGLPDHTPLESLMEDALLVEIRSSTLDIVDYVARNLTTPEAWAKGNDGYRNGFIHLAHGLVIGAVERGAH